MKLRNRQENKVHECEISIMLEDGSVYDYNDMQALNWTWEPVAHQNQITSGDRALIIRALGQFIKSMDGEDTKNSLFGMQTDKRNARLIIEKLGKTNGNSLDV